jgi:hypothetical protein
MEIVKTHNVSIDIVNSFAQISSAPVAAALIAGELRHEKHDFARGPVAGRWPVHSETLVRRDDGRLTVLAGHVPRAKHLLEDAGYVVETRDHRRDRRPLYVNSWQIEPLTPLERQFVDALTAHRQGQILVHREAERLRILELTVRHFPSASIAVLVATKSQGRRLYNELRQRLPRPVSISFASGRLPKHSLVVTSLASHLALGDFDVAVFPFAEQIASAHGFHDAAMNDRRTYGVLLTSERLERRSQLLVEGILGPPIFEVPDPRGPRSRVVILTFEPPWSPAPLGLSALERKRQCIWRADLRNHAVAEVAEAIAAGDVERLWPHGLLLEQQRADPRRVAVVVESPEHARALLAALPGWHPFDAGAVLDRTVLTIVQASRLAAADCDAILWAAGGTSLVEPRGFPPRGNRDVLLVDALDDFDPRAVEETQERLDSYRKRGWTVHRRPSPAGHP